MVSENFLQTLGLFIESSARDNSLTIDKHLFDVV
jgi:hypothetical protein